MKRLNNKGYMLVEIILAFAIAMAVMYFLMELTIKLKNRNDDLVVRTLAATDQAIIYNTIMKEVYAGTFSCSNVTISDKVFTYTYKDDSQFKNIINEYSNLSNMECSDTDKIEVYIPMTIKQLSEDFSVRINTKMEKATDDGGSTPPVEDDDDDDGGTVTQQTALNIHKDTGVSQICYRTCYSGSCGSYRCFDTSTVQMFLEKNKTLSVQVYGIAEDGYVMDSCTVDSPCTCFEQYPDPMFPDNYIIYMYHPWLTATPK